MKTMKTINHSKILFILLGFTYSLFSFATPVTWVLAFEHGGFDWGSGQFTYDPTTTACIPKSIDGCMPDPSNTTGYINGFDVNTKIDSITLNVTGEGTFGDSTQRPLENLWWDETFGLMSIVGGKESSGATITTLYKDNLELKTFDISSFHKVSKTVWESSFGIIWYEQGTSEHSFDLSGSVAAISVSNSDAHPQNITLIKQ